MVVILMAKGKYAYWLTEEGLIKLEGWAKDGLSDEQIADNMGIATSSLYVWKNKYVEIAEALKKGKEIVDRHVENALYKRATGYSYEEVVEEFRTNKETGEIELTAKKKMKKHMPADVAAIVFWLCNRKRDDWKQRRNEIISEDDEGGVIEITKVQEVEHEK